MDIRKDTTDVTRYIFLADSTDGSPETGYTITNLDLQYTRNRTIPAAKADAIALGATNSSHANNKAIEIDGTSSPGMYRVDWPDSAFTTGVDKVLLVVSGAGLQPAVEEITLVDEDLNTLSSVPKYILEDEAISWTPGTLSLPFSQSIEFGLNAFRGMAVELTDNTDSRKEVVGIESSTAWAGGVVTLVLDYAPTFTPVSGDLIKILPNYVDIAIARSSTIGNTINLSSAGRADSDIQLFTGSSARNTVLGSQDETHRTLSSAINDITTAGSVPRII